MSTYENVVGGKLKLKGKALDVKAASGTKKKKKKKSDDSAKAFDSAGGSTELLINPGQEEVGDASKSTRDDAAHWDDHLTPAERRYVEQRAKIDMHKLAKTANKSHRDLQSVSG